MAHSATAIQRAYRRFIEQRFLATSAIKVQAISRGAIIRMRLHAESTHGRVWVPYNELENLQMELENVATERDDLLAAKESMQYDIGRLQGDMADIANAREAETKNLQNELAEKVSMQKEISTLKSKVSEITASKESAVDNQNQELASVRQQLDNAKKEACQEQEQLSSRISSLETGLLESKQEGERLGSAMQSTECSNTEAVARMEKEKKDLINQVQELSQQNESLSSEVKQANVKSSSLSIEVDDAKIAALLEQQQHSSRMSSLETELLESKQVEVRLVNGMKSLEITHADALTSVEEEKNDLISQNQELLKQNESLSSEVEQANERNSSLSVEIDNAKKAACQEQEQLSSRISSLETELLESKQEEERLTNAATSLGSTHADALTSVEEEKNDLINQNQELSQQNESLLSDVEQANERNRSLSTEVDDVKEVACQEQEQLSSKISALETELLESKQEEERLVIGMKSFEITHADALVNVAKSLERTHAHALTTVEEEKNNLINQTQKLSQRNESLSSEVEQAKERNSSLSVGIDDAKKVACQEQEQLSSQISALEAELLESKQEEERLVNVAKSLEGTHVNTLMSAETKFVDAKKEAWEEKGQLSSRVSSLEAQLLESKAEVDRQCSTIESMECTFAEVLARVEEEKHILIKQNQELSQRIGSLSSVVEHTNERNSSLSIEVDGAKKAACIEQVQFSSKISSLMADLITSKENEGMQDNMIQLLKSEYEDYQHDNQSAIEEQMRSCESKLEPHCLVDRKDQTLHDLLMTIQMECSDIIAKSKTTARELESSHGFQLQNGNNLRALDEFTNSVVEVMVDGELKKLLISFCHILESASAEMSIEVSLM